MSEESGFRPWREYERYAEAEMRKRAGAFADDLHRRRSIRSFSPEAVPRDIIEQCLRAAGSAPSGANKQPWHFAVVTDPAVKGEIRAAAEVEERAFYSGRAPDSWLADLAPLGTDAEKPFLEIAPCLIVIFAERFEEDAAGEKHKNYYVPESVGIATGMLLAALHQAGLATLTHTPSPMGFLREILKRPRNERPFLIVVTGYPAEGVSVPDIERKALEDIISWHDGAA
ncbi:MAG: nitroreductase family protein [Pseudomonadota bacterium]